MFFLASRPATQAFSIIFSLCLACSSIASLDLPSFTKIQSSGFIGCLHEDVCNELETCFNDDLYGRCVEKAELAKPQDDSEMFTFTDSQIAQIRDSLPPRRDSFSNFLVQCIFRAHILSVKLDLEPTYFDHLCFNPIQNNEDISDNLISSSNTQVNQPATDSDFTLYDYSPSYIDSGSDHSQSSEDFDFIEYPVTDEEFKIATDSNDNLNSRVKNVQHEQSDSKTPLIFKIDLKTPLKSDSEASNLAKIVSGFANSDSTPYNFSLSADGRSLRIQFNPKNDHDSSLTSNVLERIRRLARNQKHFPIEDYQLLDMETKRNSIRPIFENRSPKNESARKYIRSIIIASSVVGVVCIVLTIYGAQWCIRRRNDSISGIKKLNLLDDDEKALCHDKNESKDILSPLTEATKSAKTLLAGASGYFSGLTGKRVSEKIPHKDNKSIQKQISNSSIVSGGSQRTSSTSSWSGEPVKMDIDITTGHLILTYLEQHLHNRNRLEADWESICKYEADDAVICEAASRECNKTKNRPNCVLPYEQSRVKLRDKTADYINASLLFDHDPRNPAYIATATPMRSTVADFWRMLWEQSSIVIVALDRPETLIKMDSQKLKDAPFSPVQYWPDEGSEICGAFEIHLVSEHTSCSDYMVRSFYLKNLETNETRTVTQFHFLPWPIDGKPLDNSCVNSLLEFRRKVNKSFRGKGSPIVVHCPDGSGVTGTYLLLDLALNRIQSGIKELNIAASLEHLRDQRHGMVQTKEQFEFVLTAIAEEVNSLLKSVNGGSN